MDFKWPPEGGAGATGSIELTGDVTAGPGPSPQVATITPGVIDNADINASAGITLTKLAATTASRALVSDASGFISPSAVTSTQLGYVSGVTSSIQTQLNAKQATGDYLTALTGDVVASGPGSAAATIQAGVVTNATVNASAGIVYSKLNLSTSIVNADISASAAIAYSKLALTGSILNADVNASAAIALTKLATTTASRALVSSAGGVITPTTTTATEIGYVNGVTSAIQTQLNLKAPLASPTFTGTITTPLTASRAVVTGGAGVLSAATTTSTEIGYVNGVTSAIQTQLDAKQARSTLTTKGDLYVATASSTTARQAVGTDGHFLVADSTQANGIKYAPFNNVYCTGYRITSNQTVATSAVVIFNSTGGANEDPLGMLNTSTGVITVPVTGMYLVCGTILFSNAASGATNVNISILKNGGLNNQIYASNSTDGGITTNTCTFNTMMYLTAGNTISISVSGDASFDVVGGGSGRTFICVSKIGNQ